MMTMSVEVSTAPRPTPRAPPNCLPSHSNEAVPKLHTAFPPPSVSPALPDALSSSLVSHLFISHLFISHVFISLVSSLHLSSHSSARIHFSPATLTHAPSLASLLCHRAWDSSSWQLHCPSSPPTYAVSVFSAQTSGLPRASPEPPTAKGGDSVTIPDHFHPMFAVNGILHYLLIDEGFPVDSLQIGKRPKEPKPCSCHRRRLW